jgi:ferredoxin
VLNLQTADLAVADQIPQFKLSPTRKPHEPGLSDILDELQSSQSYDSDAFTTMKNRARADQARIAALEADSKWLRKERSTLEDSIKQLEKDKQVLLKRMEEEESRSTRLTGQVEAAGSASTGRGKGKRGVGRKGSAAASPERGTKAASQDLTSSNCRSGRQTKVCRPCLSCQLVCPAGAFLVYPLHRQVGTMQYAIEGPAGMTREGWDYSDAKAQLWCSWMLPLRA